MIAYRDQLARELKLRLVVGQNEKALAEKKTFVDGLDRISCCRELKSGKFRNIAERSGRAQDIDGGGTLEKLRKDGYM